MQKIMLGFLGILISRDAASNRIGMPANSKEPTGPELNALLEGLIEADIKFI